MKIKITYPKTGKVESREISELNITKDGRIAILGDNRFSFFYPDLNPVEIVVTN